MRRLALLALAWMLPVGCLVAGCRGASSAPSPFLPGPEAGAGSSSEGGASPVTAPEAGGFEDAGVDGVTGPPCLDDQQCDDGIACTFDRCDPAVSRCRFVPDDFACADESFCNGVERCARGVGCRAGEPVGCADGTPCTIDRCDESTRTCEHSMRDADGDGDGDENCEGGADCDETDPLVSSRSVEICDNDRDDDCDGTADETQCERPRYDTCADPLEISGSGIFDLSAAAASGDYAASCVESEDTRDLVAAVVVPEGPPIDVDLVLSAGAGEVALALAEQCSDASTEMACAPGARSPGQRSLSRLRLRALEPGTYPLYLFAEGVTQLTLRARYVEPEPEPANETCGTAIDLELGEQATATLVDAATDVDSACETQFGDLVYRVVLNETRDLRVVSTSVDDYGIPSLSLRDADCIPVDSEIVCRTSLRSEIFWRALPAGEYFVRVSATGPTDLRIRAIDSPPTEPPADESCESAPPIDPGSTFGVSLEDHIDDIRLGCLQGAPDAAYELNLAERSDVLLVQQLSEGDEGAVSLASPACQPEPLACSSGDDFLVRTAAHDLPPGAYRVVVESLLGNPSSLTPLTRPAEPPALVAFADTCDGAIDVAPQGGFFQGNTANASADYESSCDRGGVGPGGGRDQMLRLSLAERRRVVLDMRGSAYRTLLSVRRGPGCPGEEIERACAAGLSRDRSFLDLELDPGEYYVQVDGYGGADGRWFLDAYIVDP